MNPLRSPLVLVAAALFGVSPLVAQQPAAASAPRPAPGRISPHETVGAVIDGNRVTIIYGRPYTKDPKSGEIRTVWGGKLVPPGKIWRTGADEATLLLTEQAIEIGGAVVPAGAYTLWTWMGEDGTAKLVINKQVGQWGTNKDMSKVYKEANDLVRVNLTKGAAAKTADQFTMAVEKNPGGGGFIRLIWADAQYSAPFTVKK